jgi:Holliday junction resolvase
VRRISRLRYFLQNYHREGQRMEHEMLVYLNDGGDNAMRDAVSVERMLNTQATG